MIQQTLVLIKPDATKRNLIGEIISRYEKAGLIIVKMEYYDRVSDELAKKHYPQDDDYLISIGNKSISAGDPSVNDPLEQGKRLMDTAISYFTSGPVLSMILKGEEAIPLVRKITGFTDPSKAEKGTIRGDFGKDSILQANREGRLTYNLVHASGDPDEAIREIKLWFPDHKSAK